MDQNSLTRYFSPRLLDYIIFTGVRKPIKSLQPPELLRRYPISDHSDFPLPPDVVFFCQPEGCKLRGPKQLSLRESEPFVFSLTEKDTSRVRYGICVNFNRRLDDRTLASLRHAGVASRSRRRSATHTLTSLCIISHHPFFSTFRECLGQLRRLVTAANDRTQCQCSTPCVKETVWNALLGNTEDAETLCPSVLIAVQELETWILRLLSAPVAIPGETRVELSILPKDAGPPLVFALPDHTRFSLFDFPLHLPLELLGVDNCITVLTCILLEHKVVLQSKDYNALSMSVMALVSLLYPMEFMFPVIPLLPTCMASAEQLLLAPTPFLIGIPATFLSNDRQLADDIWLVNLDTSSVHKPPGVESLPPLPPLEGAILHKHLHQCLESMRIRPPTQELSSNVVESSSSGKMPLLYGNDVDSVDVAIRVAMVRFYNSPGLLANFMEHTRTLRLYPRPVVAFQVKSFLQSRPNGEPSIFIQRLVRTQAVEYFAEWCLSPTNVAFQRVHTGLSDPRVVGDKPKWYAHTLKPVLFDVWPQEPCVALRPLTLSAGDNADSGEESGLEDSEDTSDEDSSDRADFIICDYSAQVMNTFRKDPALTRTFFDHSKVFSPPKELCPHVFKPPLEHPAHDAADSSPDDGDTSDSSYGEGNDEDREGDDSGSMRATPTTPQPPVRTDSAGSDQSVSERSASAVAKTFSSVFNRAGSLGSQTPKPLLQKFSKARENLSKAHRVAEELSEASKKKLKAALSDRSLDSAEAVAQKITSSTSNAAQAITAAMHQQRQHQGRLPPSGGSINQSPESSLMLDLAAQTQSVFTGLFAKSREKGDTFGPFKGRKSSLQGGGALLRNADNSSSGQTSPSHGVDAYRQKSSHQSENQRFLMETVQGVLDGKGVKYLHQARIKQLLYDENHRNLILSRLNKTLERKVGPDDRVQDVEISRDVFKGTVKLLTFIIQGLEQQAHNGAVGSGGTASAMQVLEIAHTHYYVQNSNGATLDDSLAVQASVGSGSVPSLLSATAPMNVRTTALSQGCSPYGSHDNLTDPPNSLHSIGSQRVDSTSDLFKSGFSSMRRMVSRIASTDSQVASDLDSLDAATHSRSNSAARSTVSDSDVDSQFFTPLNSNAKRSSVSSLWSRSGSVAGSTQHHHARHAPMRRVYVYEELVGRDRSRLWDDLEFWEETFFDAVSQERDLFVMDQQPADMLERYRALGELARKRLEHDEDRLLATLLRNLIAFMVMVKVPKMDIARKARRLLGKCHISLACSAEVNELLDQISHLDGNSISLKPLGSQQMLRQTFTVRFGTDAPEATRFMEVREDGIILRTSDSCIVERYFFERIVNMTYSPANNVLCLGKQNGQEIQLHKYYTKKCKSLYDCIKAAMDNAKERDGKRIPGPEIGGDFPIADMQTGEGGILQVYVDGVGLLFENSKFFVRVENIYKCHHTKTGFFVLFEIDPKTQEIIERKFKSQMAESIFCAMLSVFSYLAAGPESQEKLPSPSCVPQDSIASPATS